MSSTVFGFVLVNFITRMNTNVWARSYLKQPIMTISKRNNMFLEPMF